MTWLLVAVGLLSKRDLNMLGQGFTRAYPVNPNTDFSDLLKAIDVADQAYKAKQAR